MHQGARTLGYIICILLLIANSNLHSENFQNQNSFSVDSKNVCLKILSRARIYFGHQSIGMNIIRGITEHYDNSQGLNFRIVDFSPTVSIDYIKTFIKEGLSNKKGFFAHGGIGKNGDPISKMEDFERQIEKGFDGEIDIAIFKLCYADFNNVTVVRDVFHHYEVMIEKLKNKFPNVTFVHLTTPLRNPRPTLWNKARIALGYKGFEEYKKNLIREEYNGLLRKKFGVDESLFDLAKIESTGPEGKTCGFKLNGKYSRYVCPIYTYDGGHFTKLGRNKVASELIIFLSDIVNKS